MKRLLLVLLSLGLQAEEGKDWPSPVTWKPDPRAVSTGLYIEPHAAAKKTSVAFTVRETAGVACKQWPVRGSIPLYRGELADPTRVRLVDSAGKAISVQGRATAYWPEKTIRFLCLDFVTDLAANEEKAFTLEFGTDITPGDAKALVKAEDAKHCEVIGGGATYIFKTGSDLLEVAVNGGKRKVGPVTGELKVAKDEKGSNPVSIPLTVDGIEISERGPVQTTVHVLGHYGDQKTACQQWISSVEGYKFPGKATSADAPRYPLSLFFRIYKDSQKVYLEHTIGYNGDEKTDFMQSYGLKFPTGFKGGTFSYGPDDTGEATSPLGVRLNQYANDHWDLSGKAKAEGKRFGGWGAIAGQGGKVLVAIREGWQNWPVAIRAEDNGDLIYEIMGEKTDRALDLRWEINGAYHRSHSMYIGEELTNEYANVDAIGQACGLRKIHELLLDFSADDEKAAEFARAHQKLTVPWPGAKRYRETKALGHLAVYDDPKWDFAKTYFKVFFSLMPLVHEVNGYYGWVDWGDLPMTDGVRDNKFMSSMGGGYGWSNGERGLCAYLFEFIAGGDRFLLDDGRAMVHHTIGMDTDHDGGDYPPGNYSRHGQVHWRQWDPNECRQGGYRGWHVYHWLTGDPEVRRLAIDAGIDAPSNRRIMDVTAENPKARVTIQGALSSVHLLSHLCWITTGDWRYARATHALAQANERYAQAWQTIPEMLPFFVQPNGEIENLDALPDGQPGGQEGYWYTYGGDDVMLEWAAYTGDATAINVLLHCLPQVLPNIDGFQNYHQPEALLLAGAFLDPDNPGLRHALDRRMYLQCRPFNAAMKIPEHFTAAAEWDAFEARQYGKNGFSICAPAGQEVLLAIMAYELMDQKRKIKFAAPFLKAPAFLHAEAKRKSAPVELDGSTMVANAAEVAKYDWLLNGKSTATGAKVKIDVPLASNRLVLQETDKNGVVMRAQCAIMVVPSGEWLFKFGKGPKEFIDVGYATVYNEEIGYGFTSAPTGGSINGTPEYDVPDQAFGCGSLNFCRPYDFQIKVPPGTYTLEMGGAQRADLGPFRPANSVNGVAINPPEARDKGYAWTYKAEVKPNDKGFITIGINPDGRYPLLSYLFVRLKD